MKQSYIYVAIGVIVVIAALFGINAYISNKSAPSSPATTTPQQTPTDQGRPSITINAKHQFDNGKHIVAGELDLPTPCHILNWTVNVVSPTNVIIDFTETTQADTCAQVITPARFKVEFNADENAKVSATVNGQPAVLNLIPASPGEDLNNFQIYIKG
jgi:hypothetical protein